jgi:hypothetical protein
MKVYLKDNNIYWLDEPMEDADIEWNLTEIQESILRNDGTADFIDGRLVIIPHAAEIVENNTTQLTKREFLAKLTPAEFATIKAAAASNAIVDYYWQLFMVAENIDLSHPETISGLTLLEQAGILASGRAQEILS